MMRTRTKQAARRCSLVLAGLLALLAFGAPPHAAAFCGFYVAGADTSLYANATMVVLMRDGTRTVLSMQNNYQGPPEAFALVIPVPTVLTKDQVKILPKDIFQHVDVLGAPRLVEYWETDPCTPPFDGEAGLINRSANSAPGVADAGGVKVEATFAVGEYDVVVLSADDSSGLETWLHANAYNIPNGAAAVLEPYVASGTKFFVAKVDPARVTFENGQAALSPLRFNYDTPEFSLPVRLGLLNSQGTQDLIVNILASSRYEVANHPNVIVPTNIRVQNDVRSNFAGFYESLFSTVVAKNPGAVVTEYSWDASSCDPCPTPPLEQSDLATLGADVTKGLGGGNITPGGFASYTLTRLHYRYTRDTLGEDLVFKQAQPLVGGRGLPDNKGQFSDSLQPGGSGGSAATYNNFQGRYVILHPWTNAIACQNPIRGTWGGPSGAAQPMTQAPANTALRGVAPQAASLPDALAESLPALQVTATHPHDAFHPAAASGSGGSYCSFGAPGSAQGSALAWAGGVWLLLALRSRKHRRAG